MSTALVMRTQLFGLATAWFAGRTTASWALAMKMPRAVLLRSLPDKKRPANRAGREGVAFTFDITIKGYR
jgi:hypothetical protein